MANMRCTFRKMEIFMESLTALGQNFHVGGELFILPERVSKIMQWPPPTDKTSLRSFLGAIQICKRWVKNFSEIARPLTRLQGSTKAWTWSIVEETSFRILKNKCSITMAMHGIDWTKEVRCYFDAFNFAGGFALTQVQNLIEVPIIFDSFSFSPVQRKYGTFKRELLSIVHFATKYKHYVTSPMPAIFFTDHKPIVSFLNSDRHDGIYARWALKLREMHFEFVHIDGKRNSIADGLSRTIFPGDEPMVDDEVAEMVRKKDDEGDSEWFWKDGKGGYEELVKRRINEETKGKEKGEGFPKVLSSPTSLLNLLCSCYLLLSDGRTKFPMYHSLRKSDDTVLVRCRKCSGTMGEGHNGSEGFREVGTEFEYGSRATGVQGGASEVEKAEKWKSDDWYRDIYIYLSEGGRTPEGMDTLQRTTFKINADRFRIINGNLYQLNTTGRDPTPCILENDVRRVLLESHDECDHYASSQIISKLQKSAWWPGRNSDVKTYVDSCINCARYGPAVRSHSLQPTLTFRPFDLVGMDFIGPLPTSTNGYRHIFHVVDYFSRFTKAWACKKNNASEVIRCLRSFFEEYPLAVCIYSDRGTHFTSPETQRFLAEREICHILSLSGASKSTGMIERHNQELEKALKKMCGEAQITGWDQVLGRASRAINTRRIVALGYTPFELLFGVHPRLSFEYTYPKEELSKFQARFTKHNHSDIQELHGKDWEDAILGRCYIGKMH